jgi:3-hydroxyisobutyrate dehydrogenase-like beta-hydroxyacid dehydrogenase
MHISPEKPTVGIVGFGEVGKIFAADLNRTGAFSQVSAWDLKFNSNFGVAARRQCAQARLLPCASCADLVLRSDLIISAVTAANTLDVARQVANYIGPNQVFLDLNSASPATKQSAGRLIGRAKAHYVEAGVMTSVPPYRIAVPMLLGGQQAAALSTFLNSLGMDTEVASTQLGVASAIKMCRSIVIKGLEGLVIESYTTARKHAVERQVLASLSETFPSIDWQKQGDYFFARVAKHGKRRAEEMRESALTVAQSGIKPIMASATAQKHQTVANLAAAGLFGKLTDSASVPWQKYADVLIMKARP